MFERAEKGLYIKCSEEGKKRTDDPGKGAPAISALPEKSIKKYTGGSRGTDSNFPASETGTSGGRPQKRRCYYEISDF